MAEVLKLRLGSDVVCKDASAGRLKGIIVDPETRAATHLDVSSHHHDDGRLVPVGIVESTDTAIHLACTLEEFLAFGADVLRTVSSDAPGSELFVYDEKALIQGVGTGGFGMLGASVFGGYGGRDRIVETDAVPEGELDLEQRAPVHAADGHVGHADGLVLDKGDNRITHLLLAERHLFGNREVAIPFSAVTELGGDGVRVSLNKAEIEALASVDE